MLVVGTMAAFPNNIVATHSNHFANLTFNRNTLTLLGNSKIKLLSNASELMGGGIVVSTSTQYEVLIGCLSVQPVGKPNTYSITPYQGRIYIRAEQGDVLVRKAIASAREVSIAQGKTLAITNACKAGEQMAFAADGDKIGKLVWGAAAGTGAGVVVAAPKQPISPDSRNVR